MAVNMNASDRFNNFCDGYFSVSLNAKSIGKAVVKGTIGLPVSIIVALRNVAVGTKTLCSWTWEQLTNSRLAGKQMNSTIATANANTTAAANAIAAANAFTISVNRQKFDNVIKQLTNSRSAGKQMNSTIAAATLAADQQRVRPVFEEAATAAKLRNTAKRQEQRALQLEADGVRKSLVATPIKDKTVVVGAGKDANGKDDIRAVISQPHPGTPKKPVGGPNRGFGMLGFRRAL